MRSGEAPALARIVQKPDGKLDASNRKRRARRGAREAPFHPRGGRRPRRVPAPVPRRPADRQRGQDPQRNAADPNGHGRPFAPEGGLRAADRVEGGPAPRGQARPPCLSGARRAAPSSAARHIPALHARRPRPPRSRLAQGLGAPPAHEGARPRAAPRCLDRSGCAENRARARARPVVGRNDLPLRARPLRVRPRRRPRPRQARLGASAAAGSRPRRRASYSSPTENGPGSRASTSSRA